MGLRIPILLTLVAVAAAGCTSPKESALAPPVPDDDSITTESVTGAPGAVGGSVRNSAPTVESFTPSATTGENRGAFVVVFSGSVKDRNAEAQIANISVAATGPVALASNRAIVAADRAATTPPADFGADGWKVWGATPNDGVLHFQYRQTFPAFTPAGSYAFTAHVRDQPGLSGFLAAPPVVLSSFSDITIDPTPVDAAGAALPGANWGGWSAEGGDRDVASTNWLKLVNTGDAASPRIVIDFDTAFRGSPDANFSIPVADNVQFAWFEDTTPAQTAPSEGGAPAFQPANAEGTVTVQFTGKGHVVYVTYRIRELPEILPAQPYGISFTVTELPS